MATGPAELVLWSVLVPGAIGTLGGLAARMCATRAFRDSDAKGRWAARLVSFGVPAIAAVLGYWAAQVTHRGWPSESPVVAEWPPLASFSGSSWVLWLVTLAALVGVGEAVLSGKRRGQLIARWVGRLVVVGVLLWTMMRSVIEREFDGAGESALWLAGVGGLVLASAWVLDLAATRSGVRGFAGGLAIIGTAAAIAIHQAGSAPQAQVLGGLLAALGGIAVIGGANARWLAGPIGTIVSTMLVSVGVVGHFYVYPEFDAWVWAFISLSPGVLAIGSLPLIRKIGPIKRCGLRLVAAAWVAGGVVAVVGVPAMPGAESETPYSY